MTDYETINLQLQGLLEGECDEIVIMANASAHLYHALSELNWLGFYRLIDGILVLGPFQGKPACTRIPLTKGVCGACVTRGETIVVPNVHEFPGHIACDSASNSEIVIPIRDKEGKICCILDVDSPKLDRFSEEDKIGLEQAVGIIETVL